jgi:hypothetical protein
MPQGIYFVRKILRSQTKLIGQENQSSFDAESYADASAFAQGNVTL